LDDKKDLQSVSSEVTATVYTAEVSKLAVHFKSNAVNGLTEEVAASRVKQHGRNKTEITKELPLWIQFVRCFCIYFSPLLWIATVLMLINWLIFPLRFTSNYYLVAVALLLITIIATGLSLFWRVSMFI
jgi:magnesium-transporting ATPase (P-type)